MKIELKNERLNPHLKRKELEIGIDHEGEPTPTKAALQQLAAKQFGHDADKTDVRGIYTEGGTGKSRAKVFVWNEKKAAKEKKEEAKAEEKKEVATEKPEEQKGGE